MRPDLCVASNTAGRHTAISGILMNTGYISRAQAAAEGRRTEPGSATEPFESPHDSDGDNVLLKAVDSRTRLTVPGIYFHTYLGHTKMGERDKMESLVSRASALNIYYLYMSQETTGIYHKVLYHSR